MLLCGGAALAGVALPSLAGSVSAIVHKPSVDVHSGPGFRQPTIATPSKDASVTISGQQGLWFQVARRVNPASCARRRAHGVLRQGERRREPQALFTGKAGKGHVTETAGVRGLDESDLKSAGFDAAQFAKLEGYRLAPDAAAVRRACTALAIPRSRTPPRRNRPPHRKAARPRRRSAAAYRSLRGLLSEAGVSTAPPATSAPNVADAGRPANRRKNRRPKNWRSARRSPDASWARRSFRRTMPRRHASIASGAGWPRILATVAALDVRRDRYARSERVRRARRLRAR